MNNNLKDLVIKTQRKWADYILAIRKAHKKNENLIVNRYNKSYNKRVSIFSAPF